jgi:hypothetical protein
MATILFAWEYGGNLGHMALLTPIADLLASRGHRCLFAVRDPRPALKLWGEPRYPLLAAPAPPVKVSLPPAMGTYAEVLYADGYADLATTSARAHSWRALLDLVKPDLVIGDYAPAVTFFAPETLRTLSVGLSFAVPPALSQLPNVRTWMPTDRELTKKIEMRVRETVASVRQSLGLPHQGSLGEMAQPSHNILFSLPELDCYDERDNAEYLPPPISARDKAPLEWPNVDGTKVFAYFYGNHPHIERFVSACSRLPCNVLAVLTNAPQSLIDAAPSNVCISTRPVDPLAALNAADIVALHGGTMTVNTIMRGKPLLLFPTQTEQMTASLKVVATGAGLMVQDVTGKPDFLGTMRKLLSDASYRIAAERLKEKYAHLNDENTAAIIADRVEAMIANSG